MTTRYEVLRAVAKLRVDNGYSPSVRELCKETGLSSPSSVHAHLAGLANEGLVTWQPGSSRSVILTAAGVRAL